VVGGLWRGAYPLKFEFWGFFVLGTAICDAASNLLGKSGAAGVSLFVTWGVQVALFLGYPCFAAVGVWRSAKVGDVWIRWGWAARIVVVLWIAKTLGDLWSGWLSPLLSTAHQ
jgi:hypothetical protein